MYQSTDPFYTSPRWRKLRRAVLRRDGYQCQIAKRYGKIIEATTVHHIFPREKYPQYQWKPWNLLSVSLAAHNSLHDRETDELTTAGKDLMRRTAQDVGIDFE